MRWRRGYERREIRCQRSGDLVAAGGRIVAESIVYVGLLVAAGGRHETEPQAACDGPATGPPG
jgi:hypothetical protein